MGFDELDTQTDSKWFQPTQSTLGMTLTPECYVGNHVMTSSASSARHCLCINMLIPSNCQTSHFTDKKTKKQAE